jgi:hypothetical protein
MSGGSWRGPRGRFWIQLFVGGCLAGQSACTVYHVYQVGGPGGREAGNQPMTEWESKTLNSFFWGAVRQDLPIDNCRLGNGTRTNIEEVKITSNLGSTVATIFTLGIWRPLKVGWRCARPPGLRDTLSGGAL